MKVNKNQLFKKNNCSLCCLKARNAKRLCCLLLSYLLLQSWGVKLSFIRGHVSITDAIKHLSLLYFPNQMCCRISIFYIMVDHVGLWCWCFQKDWFVFSLQKQQNLTYSKTQIFVVKPQISQKRFNFKLQFLFLSQNINSCKNCNFFGINNNCHKTAIFSYFCITAGICPKCIYWLIYLW